MTEAVSVAAETLVREKYDLDRQRRVAGQQPAQPAAFVQYALPHANTADRSRTGSFEFIPSELVVGATWAGRWFPMPEGAAAVDLCERLDENVRDQKESWPLLYRVGSLPLWFAGEGKNRVELYQRLGRPIFGEARLSAHLPAAELAIQRGTYIAGVARVSIPVALLPLPVPAAAALLVAAGAADGAPLPPDVEQRLLTRANRGQALLNTRY